MLKGLFKTMRPKQWAKNIFLFAALVFDEKLFHTPALLRTIAAFFLFCLLSSSVYLINDLVDIEKDRQHPRKRKRPLASGQLKPTIAIAAAAAIILITIPLSFWLDSAFGLIAAIYLFTMITYSFVFKNIVIVDVLVLAAGYVLRVMAGSLVVHVERFSPWLYVCTTFLALFIGITKRKNEIIVLADNANNHRAILQEYSEELLDDMINLVTAVTVMAYCLYTFSAPNLPPNHAMMLTIPFVLYGIFRYLYLIHIKGQGGAPEEVILRDKPLLLDVALWGILAIAILYLF